MERRRKASAHLNAELSTLVEDEDSFKDVAPLLFGRGFDQKAKDCMEAIKSLKKTVIPAGRSFQRSHPPQSRGGGMSRGMSRGRGRGTKNFRPKRT